MEIKHSRERFDRKCVASSRGAYVMHSHKKMLEENHTSAASFFAAVKVHTPKYYVKCWDFLVEVSEERASHYPSDMVIKK